MAKQKQTPDDIRRKIAQIMVDAVSQGTPPWRKPWSSATNTGSPCNFHSGRRYTGINPLILMWTSLIDGYTSKFWGSSSAWLKQVGAHVVREQHSTHITFFRMLPKRDPKTGKVMQNSKGKDILFPMLREFPIFNIEQLQAPTVETLLDGRCKAGSGSIVKVLLGHEDRKARSAVTTRDELLKIAERYLPAKQQPKPSSSKEKIATSIHEGIKARMVRYLSIPQDLNNEPDFQPAEDFITATGAVMHYKGDRAFYSTSEDSITVPNKRKFESMPDFYETVFHELMHWTEKLGRVGTKVFDGTNEWVNKYAFNELVAEIGACLLLVELGVPLAEQMVEKSKGYVTHWLSGMKNDPKFIFDAATQAGKSVDFLLGFIGRQNPVYEEATSEQSDDEAERAVA